MPCALLGLRQSDPLTCDVLRGAWHRRHRRCFARCLAPKAAAMKTGRTIWLLKRDGTAPGTSRCRPGTSRCQLLLTNDLRTRRFINNRYMKRRRRAWMPVHRCTAATSRLSARRAARSAHWSDDITAARVRRSPDARRRADTDKQTSWKPFKLIRTRSVGVQSGYETAQNSSDSSECLDRTLDEQLADCAAFTQKQETIHSPKLTTDTNDNIKLLF